MTHTDADRIAYDPYFDGDTDIKLRQVRIRTAKKEHPCAGPYDPAHTIKPGERYRHERALIDGDFWGDYKICLCCVDRWLDEILGQDEEDEE